MLDALSVVLNLGIVPVVSPVIVQVLKSGVGLCGVNVWSHKRRGPNDAIAHRTPTLRSLNGRLLDLCAQPVILSVHTCRLPLKRTIVGPICSARNPM